VLGIHADSGHSWVSIHDSEDPADVRTIGAWPDVKAGNRQRIRPDSDRRYNFEKSRTPEASRYKVLTDAQYKTFQGELSKPWKYDPNYHGGILCAPQPNCVTSAKEIWQRTTGEKVKTKFLTYDDPAVLIKSVSRLEKKDPTGKLAPPLYRKDSSEKKSSEREPESHGGTAGARGGGALPREPANSESDSSSAKAPSKPTEDADKGSEK